eukprot:9693482-Heterocapsa_arctica.AAC.1
MSAAQISTERHIQRSQKLQLHVEWETYLTFIENTPPCLVIGVLRDQCERHVAFVNSMTPALEHALLRGRRRLTEE